jgi:predicted DNA binding CopG/RHH family protein
MKGPFMKKEDDWENAPFDFSRARRPTLKELEEDRKAIEAKLGIKLPSRGRPPKQAHERHKPVSIRLHPKAIAWAKQEAKRRGVGYQTVINDILLSQTA